ncbi:MAG TPA: A/G-specific adenine glycosylase [Bdellovibrionota bacterium]|jgi:A/G-specific adenine glycosylase
MNPARLHREILAWYGEEKRDLPWRRSRDPYRIWISEIMLQQTRVEAVLPYFERFLSNFPTVNDLAEAELDRVLNLWAGLGYYSRARNLHAAAKQVVRDFHGKFPQHYDELRTLKGIGPYTAAAIASMAFHKAHCSIDGNLERVFARLLALKKDPKAAGKSDIAELGKLVVERGQAGDVNQAFMDLASAICLPRNPLCELCPIQSHCEAKRQGEQADFPVKKPKVEKTSLRASAWAVISGKELLLARRAKGEWLAGMWDLPWDLVGDKDVRKSAPFGHELASCSQARSITRYKVEFEVRGLVCRKRPTALDLSKLCAKADEFRWVKLEELHGINLPRPSEKALEKLLPKLN